MSKNRNLSRVASTQPGHMQADSATFTDTVTASAFIGSGAQLTGTTSTPAITLNANDNTADAAPIMEFVRQTAQANSADYLGQIKFRGEDSGGADEVYAKITGKIADPTHATEDGLIEYAVVSGGSNKILARMTGNSGGKFILENSTNLEVTGDGQVDGSFGVGTASPANTNSNYGSLTLNGTTGGELFISKADTAKGNLFNYSADSSNIGLAALAADGELIFSTGGYNERMRINADGDVLIGTTSNALTGNISGVGTSSEFKVSGSVGDFQVANTGNLIAFSRAGANYISATDASASLILDTPKTVIRSQSGTEYARFDVDGLKFNGDTAAANALDDYEEGTWTPVLEGDGSAPTITYSIQNGQYTKIGNLVSVNFRIRCTTISGGSGTLRVNGLPFTPTASYYHPGPVGYTEGWTNPPETIYTQINTGYLRLSRVATAGVNLLSTSDINYSAANDIIASAVYKI